MLNKIQLLENNMINKIAAGEVVERPVSVVKELVENCIDAKSSSITIETREGGTSYIRITDNGIGIPKEQVETAFLRHATSKIINMNDLENVLTLGFRGEALSSIASVSQVEMITKTSLDITGLRIEINGGKVISTNETGSTDGTTIIVRNLFYNTPARRKFLKKPSTESGYISDIVNRFAIGHPEISFKYINNGSIILQTKGNGDLKTAILQVYGKEIAKNLMEVKFNKNNMEFSGFIGKPIINRGNRNYEHFFINGRYIKSEIVQSAVEQAYKTKLMGGKFPFYIIKMAVEPNFVDVNVHPTKLEVRFADEDEVYNTIYEGVENLLKLENIIPETPLTDKPKLTDITNDKVYIPTKKQNSVTDLIYGGINNLLSVKEDKVTQLNDNISEPYSVKLPFEYTDKYKKQDNEKINSTLIDKKENINFKNNTITEKNDKIDYLFKDFNIIGQLFATYWLIEQENSLYIVDQHAAHERILYEEFIESVKNNNKVNSQRLLQPIIINLTHKESQIINDNKQLLENFGFEIDKFDESIYSLQSVPYIVNGYASTDFFTSFFIEIIDKLCSITTSVSNIYELQTEAIATASCKAAVKGNNRLSYAEAKELIKKVLKMENPFTCPHGRPTIIEISKYELEKKFKRIQ